MTGARRALAAGLALALALAAAPSLRAQAPAPSRWWSEVDRVDRLLRHERWKSGAREAEALRAEVVRTSWHEPDLGQVLSELAFLRAVAHANRGEDAEALWEWYAAQAHERVAGAARGGPALAERDLAPYGRAADLLAGRALRRRGEPPAGEPALETGLLTDLEPATAPPYDVSSLANVNLQTQQPTPVTFEVYVDRDGRLRQPVVVSAWVSPVIVQWGLDNLQRMNLFEPARLRGEPIGSLQDVEVTLGTRSRW